LARRQHADIVDDDESARQMRFTTLAVDASTLEREIVWVRVSSVNHDTLSPESIALCPSASTKWDLPVPDGPEIDKHSALDTHSSVMRPRCVWVGIDESCSRHDSSVLPEGNWA